MTILLKSGLLKQFHKHIPKDLRSHSMVIITDNHVKKLYGAALEKLLVKNGYAVTLLSFPAGEKYKTRETKAKLESAMLKKNLGRDTCIIALGGGVVGDMAGFIAATYMRGIPYIQVPTTLLAMIDSSVGGKTAVNTPEGKNLIGAFYNPHAVIADIDCLKSLPQKQIVNGWVEALKIFLTCDALSFQKASQLSEPTLPLIKRAIALKSDIVAKDFKEQNLRAVLNFGHTIGHAIENITDYQLLHGYAVGYGILVEAQISLQKNLISTAEYQKIISAFEKLGIRGGHLKKFNINQIIALTRRDKKVKNNQTRYALLKNIGGHIIQVVDVTHVKHAFNAVAQGENHGR